MCPCKIFDFLLESFLDRQRLFYQFIFLFDLIHASLQHTSNEKFSIAKLAYWSSQRLWLWFTRNSGSFGGPGDSGYGRFRSRCFSKRSCLPQTLFTVGYAAKAAVTIFEIFGWFPGVSTGTTSFLGVLILIWMDWLCDEEDIVIVIIFKLFLADNEAVACLRYGKLLLIYWIEVFEIINLPRVCRIHWTSSKCIIEALFAPQQLNEILHLGVALSRWTQTETFLWFRDQRQCICIALSIRFLKWILILHVLDRIASLVEHRVSLDVPRSGRFLHNADVISIIMVSNCKLCSFWKSHLIRLWYSGVSTKGAIKRLPVVHGLIDVCAFVVHRRLVCSVNHIKAFLLLGG